MKVIYRISSNSNKRDRIATKEECLQNFLLTWFKDGVSDEIIILEDNCDTETRAMITLLTVTDPHVHLGRTFIRREVSAGTSEESFRAALNAAIDASPDDTPVYLVEDDYLHLPNSRRVLLEGLALADYVTLYDAPDKYGNGREAFCRVLLTPSSHWKGVISTTGTFASTVGALKRDLDIWQYFTDGKHGTAWDHAAFSCLIGEKGHSLVSPIPGLATHAERAWLAPLVDWERVAR
jgi:glycosyltransferase involved in cell wall biosynthesis